MSFGSTFRKSNRTQLVRSVKFSFQFTMINIWTHVSYHNTLTALMMILYLITEQKLTWRTTQIDGMKILFELSRTEQISSIQHL